MTEPQSTAGNDLLELLAELADYPWRKKLADGIVAIEVETRQQALDDVERAVSILPTERIEGDGNIGRHLVGRKIAAAEDYVEVCGRQAVLHAIRALREQP